MAKKNKEPKLKIIPLGGLDAIGKNMTVFEGKGDMILDDAGLMFPDDNHPGVDLILPDYTYVLENADKLRGIVITHGHEDHTGTLPYLMKDLDRNVPIYRTKMTLGLIEGKFAEHKIKNAKLVEINPGDQIKLGCFTAEFSFCSCLRISARSVRWDCEGRAPGIQNFVFSPTAPAS